MPSVMRATTDNVISKLMASGAFDKVNSVEPTSPPGKGFEAAVVFEGAEPYAPAGGFSHLGMVYTILIRIYRNMLAEPQEHIDPDLLDISDVVFDKLAADYDLGATVRNVDFYGETGTGMSTRSGHLEVGGVVYRVLDIRVPVIVNDVVAFTK